ncbi:MAG: hypothetical protein M5U12_35255 [Verrucomicrobia bacterium]|nr:hypothetical protein [Verrucomicrobiota bacterium]
MGSTRSTTSITTSPPSCSPRSRWTPPFRRDILQGRSHDWARLTVEVLLRTNVPTGFPLRYAWSPGIPDHLFLADLLLAEREGWLQPASP